MPSERPPPPPRTMTPPESWDSRPKMAVAARVSDPDPLAHVARLFPRDARTPLSPSEFERQRQERSERDTDPISGHPDDQTPAARPFEIRVERELKELRGDVDAIKKSSRESAQHVLEMHELVKVMDRRQRAFELENRWVPRLAWLVTTAIAVMALIRTYR